MGTGIRPNGMASGAAALRYWERRQEISANNLANVSTDGYKKQEAFARLVENGLPTVDAMTNYSPGTTVPTGNPFDISIDGNNFFIVQTANGERLSRGGTMSISSEGFLMDSSGSHILGEKGPIRINRSVNERGIEGTGKLEITHSGIVRMNNVEVDRLRIEAIPQNTQLIREGAGLFIPPGNRQPADTDLEVVRQGTLESSNVAPIDEMVNMISIQRAYSAVQRAISTLDSARGIAVTELGKPAQ